MKKLSIKVMFAALGLSLAAHSTAQADTYPSRPITVVVPFPAGSTTDQIGRKFAEYLKGKWGANVLVDNRVGADGNIAAQHVLRQPADGYTLFMTSNSVHGANASLYKQLPFDPLKDFDMIGNIMQIPLVLTVRSDFPANNLREFIAEANKRTTPLMYGAGNTATRGGAELLKLRYGIKIEPVFYRGAPQVLTDLIGGQFDFTIVDANVVGSFLKQGRLKALAVTSEKRHTSLPNIPTVAEDAPGFRFVPWIGVVTRSQTPPEIRAKLSDVVRAFTNDPATVSFLGSVGATATPMDPTEFRTFIENDMSTWARIFSAANIERK
ncbi:tripartite tricarboxylate transporter substrate binding protein [Ramlibacter sp. 2FC]|uniref:Bug family tripartite tricarboxylate transporter substrate binding protein n=1 Tax=Ramlibacter sp. 2FC TaxID=2502188 RepID=UPI0010F97921|nr:tripartite tricarboxylate transporter substrate binding protein [Ramlibacter sp. 2FC]